MKAEGKVLNSYQVTVYEFGEGMYFDFCQDLSLEDCWDVFFYKDLCCNEKIRLDYFEDFTLAELMKYISGAICKCATSREFEARVRDGSIHG